MYPGDLPESAGPGTRMGVVAADPVFPASVARWLSFGEGPTPTRSSINVYQLSVFTPPLEGYTESAWKRAPNRDGKCDEELAGP